MDDLLFEVKGRIATITLNRPDRKNALSVPMLDAWVAALKECHENDAINVIVQTAAGDAFCAGGDVGRMNKSAENKTESALDQKNFIWKGINRVPLMLQQMDKPYLVAVNGTAAAAGMDMAMLGDMIFAAESARFGETYIRMGVIPGDGGGWLLPRLVGIPRALEMLWLGDFIDAREAERIGIVNKVVPNDQLMSYTYAIAERLANGPSVAIQFTKRLVYQARSMDFATHLDQVTSHMPSLKSTDDHKEAVKAFMEKRKPVFKGH